MKQVYSVWFSKEEVDLLLNNRSDSIMMQLKITNISSWSDLIDMIASLSFYSIDHYGNFSMSNVPHVSYI